MLLNHFGVELGLNHSINKYRVVQHLCKTDLIIIVSEWLKRLARYFLQLSFPRTARGRGFEPRRPGPRKRFLELSPKLGYQTRTLNSL